jgi:hypothetical protein
VVPYTPKAKDPPLIKAVMHNLLPHAVVRIQKIDSSIAQYYLHGRMKREWDYALRLFDSLITSNFEVGAGGP